MQPKSSHLSARTAAGALFGMLNWAPMWYRSKLDGGVDDLAGKMVALFLGGVAS